MVLSGQSAGQAPGPAGRYLQEVPLVCHPYRPPAPLCGVSVARPLEGGLLLLLGSAMWALQCCSQRPCAPQLARTVSASWLRCLLRPPNVYPCTPCRAEASAPKCRALAATRRATPARAAGWQVGSARRQRRGGRVEAGGALRKVQPGALPINPIRPLRVTPHTLPLPSAAAPAGSGVEGAVCPRCFKQYTVRGSWPDTPP